MRRYAVGVLAFLVATAALAAASSGSANARVEAYDYQVGTSRTPCAFSAYLAAELCIPIRTGDAFISLHVDERGPLSDRGPIQIRARWIDAPGAWMDFCGDERLPVRDGATALFVSIRHGPTACDDGDDDGYSGAIRGVLRVAFE